MANPVLYMSMSLDGSISGPDDGKSRPFGHGGRRLHDWLRGDGPDVAALRPSEGPSRIVFDELMATGAVITGRRTGEFVDYWGGDHRRRSRRDPARRQHRPGVLVCWGVGRDRDPARPRLLGEGRVLFDGLEPEHIELELVRTLEAPNVLHLRYEVRR